MWSLIKPPIDQIKMRISFKVDDSPLDDCTEEKFRRKFTSTVDIDETSYAEIYKESEVMNTKIFNNLHFEKKRCVLNVKKLLTVVSNILKR